MKQVFFHSNADLTTALSATPLAGDLAVVKVDGTVATALNSALNSDFYFRQYMAEGKGFRNSQIIKWGSVKSVKKVLYAAGTQQAIAVTPLAQTAGKEYGLRVTDITAGQIPFPKFTISMVGLTAAAAESKIASAVNQGRLRDVLWARGAGTQSVDLTGMTAGSVGITVNGKVYTQAFSSSAAGTATAFVAAHNTNLQALFNITVSAAGALLS